MELSVGAAIVEKMNEREKQFPHLAGGLSQHGSCLLKQILNRINPQPFESYGNVTPGTALHKYIQEVLIPSGTVIKNKEGFPTWLIIGHEQYVFLLQKHRPHRRSPIDTLVYNLYLSEYEIWDWKSTIVGGTKLEPMCYLRSLDIRYKMQCNLYAFLFKEAWELDYNPICRVIFFNKGNWANSKEFVWEMDSELAVQSFLNIDTVDRYYKTFKLKHSKEEWEGLATGLNRYSDTKKKYLKECRYCDHIDKCEDLIGRDIKKDT